MFVRAIILTLVVVGVLALIPRETLSTTAKLRIASSIVGVYVLIEVLFVIGMRYKDIFCKCEEAAVKKDLDILESI